MKITLNGFLFELENIPFRAGAVLFAQIPLPGSDLVISEKVRSIKHYDRFFRQPPKKKAKSSADSEPSVDTEQPKKLVEFHFVQLAGENRIALHKYLMQLSIEAMKQAKK